MGHFPCFSMGSLAAPQCPPTQRTGRPPECWRGPVLAHSPGPRAAAAERAEGFLPLGPVQGPQPGPGPCPPPRSSEKVLGGTRKVSRRGATGPPPTGNAGPATPPDHAPPSPASPPGAPRGIDGTDPGPDHARPRAHPPARPAPRAPSPPPPPPPPRRARAQRSAAQPESHLEPRARRRRPGLPARAPGSLAATETAARAARPSRAAEPGGQGERRRRARDPRRETRPRARPAPLIGRRRGVGPPPPPTPPRDWAARPSLSAPPRTPPRAILRGARRLAERGTGSGRGLGGGGKAEPRMGQKAGTCPPALAPGRAAPRRFCVSRARCPSDFLGSGSPMSGPTIGAMVEGVNRLRWPTTMSFGH